MKGKKGNKWMEGVKELPFVRCVKITSQRHSQQPSAEIRFQHSTQKWLFYGITLSHHSSFDPGHHIIYHIISRIISYIISHLQWRMSECQKLECTEKTANMINITVYTSLLVLIGWWSLSTSFVFLPFAKPMAPWRLGFLIWALVLLKLLECEENFTGSYQKMYWLKNH